MSEKIPHGTPLSDKDVKEVKEVPESPEGDVEVAHHEPASLTRGLQGRHMQMIAIGKRQQETSIRLRS